MFTIDSREDVGWWMTNDDGSHRQGGFPFNVQLAHKETIIFCLRDQTSQISSEISYFIIFKITLKQMSPFTMVLCLVSPITIVSCLMSHITSVSHLMSHITMVSCLMSHITMVSCLMYHKPMVSCLISQITMVTYLMSQSCWSKGRMGRGYYFGEGILFLYFYTWINTPLKGSRVGCIAMQELG